MSATPVTTVSLKFRVTDPELLRGLAQTQVDRCSGGGVLIGDNEWGRMILELLLFSNPDIKGFLDYGIELTDSTTYDWED